jgi:hypothetical protein
MSSALMAGEALCRATTVGAAIPSAGTAPTAPNEDCTAARSLSSAPVELWTCEMRGAM